jgi:hypothetical protein
MTKVDPNKNKIIASPSSSSLPFVSEYNNKLLQSTTTAPTATIRTDRSAAPEGSSITRSSSDSSSSSPSLFKKAPPSIFKTPKTSSPPSVIKNPLYKDEDGFYDWGLLSNNFVSDYDKTMQEKQQKAATTAANVATTSTDISAKVQKESIKTATPELKVNADDNDKSSLSELTESVTTPAASKDTTASKDVGDTRTANDIKDTDAAPKSDEKVSAKDDGKSSTSTSSGSLNDPLLIRAIAPPIRGDPFAADPSPSPTTAEQSKTAAAAAAATK